MKRIAGGRLFAARSWATPWAAITAITAIASIGATSMLGMAVPPAAAADSAAAESYAGSFFKRQVLIVSNLDRALTLYRDLLGFVQDGGRANTSERSSYVYDVLQIPRDAQLRTTTLNAGTRQIRTLLLAEVRGIPVPPLTGPRRTATVINANGRFAQIIAGVEKLGLKRMSPHVLDSVDPKDGRGVEQAFEDWDGNVVLLYEFPGR
jgi:catechol 2,3-dioxygenase-like lactoylglutathione lyase family enzyme